MKETNRLQVLEGLRGLAAVAVVIYHALLMFYASMFLGVGNALAPVQHASFEGKVYGSPFAVFLSGTFAVSIFFVISGFVLAVGFFETGKSEIVKKLAAKRYLRLMIPALASVLLAWLILALGLSHVPDASAISRSGWLAGMWTFVPNLFDAVQQGTWGIFTTPFNYYNPVLWTMFYEFLGSFFVFATLLLFGKLPKRPVVYAVLLVGTFHTWYFGFIIGMILADLYAHRRFPFDRPHMKMGMALIGVAVLFGGYPLGSIAHTIYASLTLPGVPAIENASIFTALGALCLIVGALNVPAVGRFLSLAPVSGLGRYTYSLYLVHKPVLFSLGAGLFVVFIRSGVHYNAAVLLTLVCAAPLIALVTTAFEHYVDRPAIQWSGIFANWLLGLPQKQGTTAYTTTRVSLWQRLRGKIRDIRVSVPKPAPLLRKERLLTTDSEPVRE